MAAQRQPWVKFYTTDWRSDPRLKMCSMAARGLWIEMICLMHEATPYGHLLVSGQCPTDAQLAVLVGAQPDQIAALLGELESAGVFSRTREGVIYSRKLSRMAKKAAEARKSGQKGGHPKLTTGYTSPGYVYAIGRRADGAVKIGISVNPRNRIKKIRAQYPAENLIIIGSLWTEDMGTLERTLHETLAQKNVGGEWFKLSDKELKTLGFISDPKGAGKGPPFPQKPEAREPDIKKEEPNGSLSPHSDANRTKPFDEIAEAVAAYNRCAEEVGWPRVQVLSKARRSALKARLKEAGGLQGWRDALSKAQASPHLCGQNDRGWMASFDFLTRQSSFTKLMEGNYDPRTSNTPYARPANSGRMAGTATAAEIADRGARWAASRATRRGVGGDS